MARSGGVLVAGVTPIGGIISGSVAAMKMEGWTREDATLRDPAAITVFWPTLVIDRSPTARRSVKSQEKKRDEAVAKLKNAFRDARAYAKARGAEGQAGHSEARRRREARGPRSRRSRAGSPSSSPPTSSRRSATPLKWAKEEKLRLVIWGGADAWRMADELAKADVPVIVDSPLDLPRREDEAYDTQFANAGKLATGPACACSSTREAASATNVRNLPHVVATAVTFGFPAREGGRGA